WVVPNTSGGSASHIVCVDCWSSANTNYGVNLSYASLRRFWWLGGKIRNNADGVNITGQDIAFSDTFIMSNRTNGVIAAAGVSSFQINNCRIGGSFEGSAQQTGI